jgi:hypothetical protein
MPTVTITTPEKLIVSENGAAEPKPQQASSGINKLLEANTTLAVWLIFFSCGGGILALYYARIGYLPDMEWKSALVYLFIGSIVGGVIGLLLTISVYLPGVIWSETIVFDPCLGFFYTPPASEHSGTEPVPELCVRTIFRYLGLPFFVVLILSHVALLAGKVGYWLIAVGLLWLTFLVTKVLFGYRSLPANSPERQVSRWRYFRTHLRNDPKNVTVTDRHIFKLASAFTLSVLLNQISMYVIYWLSGSPAELWTFIVLTLLCTAGVWIASHVVALRHQDHPRQAVAAALVAAALLLFTADNFSSLSVKLMNNFGMGYYQRVNLLVNADGKNIVDGLGVPKCGEVQLCNVEILSKVGDHYYLRVGDQAYLTLPKSHVVSIRPLHKP